MTAAGDGPRSYLDNAATAPLRPEVLEAMMPFLTTAYGNASAGHSMARVARRAVDDARDLVAAALGGKASEVVFTSGGTEADNLAVTGAVLAARAEGTPRPAIACSAVEHPAVLEPVRAAGGAELPVDSRGIVDLARLREYVGYHRGVLAAISVMLVNNETGVLQPLEAVVQLVREMAPAALVHTDAVQALEWLDVAGEAAGADLVSASAHKIGGPKGTGALLVRWEARSRLAPLLRGGPQERELRAGTLDVAGIVGFGAAAQLAVAERGSISSRVAALSESFLRGVLSRVEGVATAVPPGDRVPAICNLCFDGIESEELLLVLDELGVYASAGSACASGAFEPSHVLLAMGRSKEEARRHVRFSLGYATTAEDVDLAVGAVAQAAARLRGAA